MKIAEALAIERGSIVSFVGAGGKTSAMFRLAAELVEAGWRVVTTTTTRIARDELRLAPHHIPDIEQSYATRLLPVALDDYQHVFVYQDFTADGKVGGVSTEWIEKHLAPAKFWDALLIEADGSRRLPIKAPRSNEPPIPGATHVVVPVIGMDAMGKPLIDDVVYGANVIHERMRLSSQDRITPRLMASIVIDPYIGRKNVPFNARVVPLINKVTEETLPAAREAANHMLTDMNIERVMLAAVQESEPVIEMRQRVAAVVLAAGESRRMGEPKMLLPWDDRTIIRHIVEQVLHSDPYEVIVITGRWTDAIREQLAGLPVRIVPNPEFEHGEMLSSLKLALHAVWHTSDAVMVVLGDQPQIRVETIQAVLDSYRTGKGAIIAPSYDNRRGHPVLIDRIFWQDVLDLPHDSAPRDVVRMHADRIYHLVVDNDSVLGDIDTPQDYEEARGFESG